MRSYNHPPSDLELSADQLANYPHVQVRILRTLGGYTLNLDTQDKFRQHHTGSKFKVLPVTGNDGKISVYLVALPPADPEYMI